MGSLHFQTELLIQVIDAGRRGRGAAVRLGARIVQRVAVLQAAGHQVKLRRRLRRTLGLRQIPTQPVQILSGT